MQELTYTLRNGLRVICMPMDTPVVYCGYQIKAGSRNEATGDDGLAHFCEHMTFKGTQRRSAGIILNSLEKVGGSLNAYTNKEDTTFYASVLKEYARRAIDLLTDMVFHSVYPQREIDKEVEVICDEIESYNDSPADLIYDEYENVLFPGHPLGHNILGTADRVRQFTTADALRFTKSYYRPSNAVFFIAGDILPNGCIQGHRTPITALLEQAFDQYGWPEDDVDTTEKAPAPAVLPAPPRLLTHDRHTHQAHVMVGSRAFNFNDPRRTALSLLNNIIGGPGMNARLNIVLREHRGLVYTVESSMVAYSDTGLWSTYLGCDEKDIKRCLYLVRRELDRLCSQPMTETRLKAAKRQLKGQIGIACDNHENYALDAARYYLFRNRPYDINAQFRAIDDVTAAQLQQVANAVFAADHSCTLIYK